MTTMYLSTLLILAVTSCVSALDNGLALTPPMGWLAWERFRCNIDCKNDPDNCISERLFMTMADLMVKEGFKDVGYEYINIDDCWLAKDRDPATRKLVPDPERFPSGIKALADYVHARGLKLGIYEDFGDKTCAGYPGSEYDMELDANTFAEWEVDMLKFDGCNSDPKDMPFGYPIMQHFLNKTGRPMIYSCEWPLYEWSHQLPVSDYALIAKTCNMWRNYEDVTDSWPSVLQIVDHYGDNKGNFSGQSRPGAWNDPDMLVIGDFGLSIYQQKAQMGMWALFASPLFMSTDLRKLDPESKALLQNKNIIALNQDPLGNQAIRMFEANGFSAWVKKLARPHLGCKAFGFLNKGDNGTPTKLDTSFAQLAQTAPNGFNVTEVFTGAYVGKFGLNEEFTISVDPTSIYIMIACPL